MTELEKILDELDEVDECFDSETLELADEVKHGIEEVLENALSDQEQEELLLDVFRYDDELLEEFLDRLSFVNLCESMENIKDKDLENAYLTMIDALLELSKTINPLSGFNKDRLMSALDIINGFEKEKWPLMTRITAKNAEAFQNLIPEQHYEDVVIGKKHAIGALRHVEDEIYSAGAIVYSVLDIAEAEGPVIKIDWIYVHEDLRGCGIGNFLMAQILGMALQNEGTMVTTDLYMKNPDNESLIEEE